MIFNGGAGRPSNGMAGPNIPRTPAMKPPGAPTGPQVQPNVFGTGGTAINPVDRGGGKGVPLGPQVQPNVGGSGGTAINPVVSGDGKGVPLGPQVDPNVGGTGGTAINPVVRGGAGPGLGRQRLAAAIMKRTAGPGLPAFSPTAPNPTSTMPTLRQPPYPRG